MKFNQIEDVKSYIKFLQDTVGRDSKWYKDLERFSSHYYPSTSEYFGELVIFIERIVVDEAFKEHKSELLQLRRILKASFRNQAIWKI